MKKGVAGIQTFSFGQDLVFDAFIQFKEYIGFVKCMNAMKGMKLCYKDRDSEKAWTSNIRVDFDKTKHLAESSSKQRKAERERIIEEEMSERIGTEERKLLLAQRKLESIRILDELVE